MVIIRYRGREREREREGCMVGCIWDVSLFVVNARVLYGFYQKKERNNE